MNKLSLTLLFLALFAVVLPGTTLAANGVFGQVVWSSFSGIPTGVGTAWYTDADGNSLVIPLPLGSDSSSVVFPVTLQPGNYHLTAAGGSDYLGDQNVEQADITVSNSTTYYVSVGLSRRAAEIGKLGNPSGYTFEPSGDMSVAAGPSWMSANTDGSSPVISAAGTPSLMIGHAASPWSGSFTASWPNPSVWPAITAPRISPFGRNGYVMIEKTSSPQKTFYKPGTYTVCYDASGKSCDFNIPKTDGGSFTVELWGAGGGAGDTGAGGGGGGGYAEKTYSNQTPGSVFSVEVGAGGVGTPSPLPYPDLNYTTVAYKSGTDGGDSMFAAGSNLPSACTSGSALCATGGKGGGFDGSGAIAGAGGTGKNGDVTEDGNAGEAPTGYGSMGGIAGNTDCSSPVYANSAACNLHHQDNSVIGSPVYGFTGGLDNWSSSLQVTSDVQRNAVLFPAGGNGYQPGNGGGSGTGYAPGGNGGNGMVAIQYQPATQTSPPPSSCTTVPKVTHISTTAEDANGYRIPSVSGNSSSLSMGNGFKVSFRSDCFPEGGGTVPADITTGPNTDPGTYTVTVTGDPPEGSAHSTTFTVTVNPSIGIAQNVTSTPGIVSCSSPNPSIDVSWDSVPGATSYKLYRTPSFGGGGPINVAPSGNGRVSYADSSVSPEGLYGYQISAVVNGREGPLSNRLYQYAPTSPGQADCQVSPNICVDNPQGIACTTLSISSSSDNPTPLATIHSGDQSQYDPAYGVKVTWKSLAGTAVNSPTDYACNETEPLPAPSRTITPDSGDSKNGSKLFKSFLIGPEYGATISCTATPGSGVTVSSPSSVYFYLAPTVTSTITDVNDEAWNPHTRALKDELNENIAYATTACADGHKYCADVSFAWTCDAENCLAVASGTTLATSKLPSKDITIFTDKQPRLNYTKPGQLLIPPGNYTFTVTGWPAGVPGSIASTTFGFLVRVPPQPEVTLSAGRVNYNATTTLMWNTTSSVACLKSSPQGAKSNKTFWDPWNASGTDRWIGFTDNSLTNFNLSGSTSSDAIKNDISYVLTCKGFDGSDPTAVDGRAEASSSVDVYISNVTRPSPIYKEK